MDFQFQGTAFHISFSEFFPKPSWDENVTVGKRQKHSRESAKGFPTQWTNRTSCRNNLSGCKNIPFVWSMFVFRTPARPSTDAWWRISHSSPKRLVFWMRFIQNIKQTPLISINYELREHPRRRTSIIKLCLACETFAPQNCLFLINVKQLLLVCSVWCEECPVVSDTPNGASQNRSMKKSGCILLAKVNSKGGVSKSQEKHIPGVL